MVGVGACYTSLDPGHRGSNQGGEGGHDEVERRSTSVDHVWLLSRSGWRDIFGLDPYVLNEIDSGSPFLDLTGRIATVPCPIIAFSDKGDRKEQTSLDGVPVRAHASE